jgi:hypothetical protein
MISNNTHQIFPKKANKYIDNPHPDIKIPNNKKVNKKYPPNRKSPKQSTKNIFSNFILIKENKNLISFI